MDVSTVEANFNGEPALREIADTPGSRERNFDGVGIGQKSRSDNDGGEVDPLQRSVQPERDVGGKHRPDHLSRGERVTGAHPEEGIAKVKLTEDVRTTSEKLSIRSPVSKSKRTKLTSCGDD